MKAQELRQKTSKDLQDLLQAKRRALFELRMRVGGEASAATKPHQYKEARQEIARICTVLREQEIGS